MPRNTTKGTKQLAAALDAALVEEFDRFCAARGETKRHHLYLGLRRHLASPPPPPARVVGPPLPPVAAAAAPTPKRRSRRVSR
jgi:hypothetical protein